MTLRPALVASLLVLAATACEDKNPASDVRGNYDVVYDDLITVRLKVGGRTFESEATSEGSVTFEGDSGPIVVDLGPLCAREEVQCPSETLWAKISVDQPDIDAERPNTHVLNVVNNTVHELPAGVEAEVVSGLVDEQDRFGLILGGGSEGEGDCRLLSLSTAGGRFSHEGERVEVVEDESPDAGLADGGLADGGAVDDDGGIRGAPRTIVVWDEGAPVDGIKEGKVKLGFLGACVFAEAALVAATLELETGFTGTRTGDFDPPPFTPLDPEDVPPGLDGGVFVDGGLVVDGGATDGGLDAGVADAG